VEGERGRPAATLQARIHIFASETAPKQRNSGTSKHSRFPANLYQNPIIGTARLLNARQERHFPTARRLKAPTGNQGLCVAASQLSSSHPPTAPCGPWIVPACVKLLKGGFCSPLASTHSPFLLPPASANAGHSAYGSWELRESRTGAPRCFNNARYYYDVTTIVVLRDNGKDHGGVKQPSHPQTIIIPAVPLFFSLPFISRRSSCCFPSVHCPVQQLIPSSFSSLRRPSLAPFRVA
jgi:hypothetical protein